MLYISNFLNLLIVMYLTERDTGVVLIPG